MAEKIKSFAVIGCGTFGYYLAKSLAELGNDVLVVDMNQEVVDELGEFVTYAVCADVRMDGALDSTGLSNVDCALIGLSSDFEASIMAAMICREKKVPMVIAKARDDLHARILQRVGAQKVVIPERDIGIRLAHSLTNRSVYEYIEVSPEHSMVEIDAPMDWAGKTLGELDVRRRYGVNIIGIVNEGYSNINPLPSDTFRKKDRILVLGSHEQLLRLEELHGSSANS